MHCSTASENVDVIQRPRQTKGINMGSTCFVWGKGGLMKIHEPSIPIHESESENITFIC